MLEYLVSGEKPASGSAALRLRGARYYLDFVGRDDLPAVLHLEGDVSELEGPDLVAETVGIKASLLQQSGPMGLC